MNSPSSPTVILLGAGASLDSDVPNPPPTVKHFVREGRKLVKGDYNRLWQYAEKLGYKLNDLEEGKPTLEVLFSALEFISMELWRTSHRDYIEEVGYQFLTQSPAGFLRSFIIETTLRPSLASFRKSCSLHDRLFADLKAGDAVISFNYDLIADVSLKKTGKWNEISGYGFTDLHLAKQEGYQESHLNLLKPHGSLNWVRFTSADSDNIRVTLLKRDEVYDDLFPTAEDLKFFDKITSQVTGKQRSEMNVMMNINSHEKNGSVFIVPPSFYKFADGTIPRDLQNVWEKTAEVLRRAQKVICIGYSFGPNDLHFDTLFRMCMRDLKERDASIEIVDPDKDVSSKLSNVYGYGSRVRHIADSFRSYIDSK